MLRMISTKLKEWIKGMKDRIHPGDGEGDVEIGGDLEVDGGIKTGDLESGNIDAYLVSTNQLKAKSTIDGSIVIKDKNATNTRGYILLKDANSVIGLTDGFEKTGLLIDPADTACIGYFDNVGGPQPETGFGAGRSYLFIVRNGTYMHIDMSAEEISLNFSGGTGTLLAKKFERSEKFIASHYSLAFNATTDLGTETSGNITFTGSGMVAGEYTGVLMHGGVLVGTCYLNITSKTEATLSYQNPLGLNLASGEYTANLTKIIGN